MMGTPIIAGAGIWKMRELIGADAIAFDPVVLLAGVVASALSGLLAIWFLLRYLQNNNTDIFVIYRLGAAAVFAALLLLG